MAHLPSKFGPYEPLYRLGAGGMAETFVALRRGPAGFEQRVCIKRILPAFNNDREFVQAFLSEARTSAALRHANIAQVLDFGLVADEGSHYLALELVDGLDLRGLQEGGAVFDAELVTLIASELASALECAHAQEPGRPSVIHRDISPSNVLVSRAGEVKLTDFGIARVMGSAPRTAAGVIKGKVPYMPPEYLEHGRFDERGDLFALGVLLFELLTGERPFDGATDLDTMRRIVSGVRSPVALHAPPALAACIERLLATQPEQRLPSARALLDELPPIAVNPARRRLAELVRARSSSPPAPAAAFHEALAPTREAVRRMQESATRTRGGDTERLSSHGLPSLPSSRDELPPRRASRWALLALLLSSALLTAVGASVLMRVHDGAAAPPDRLQLPATAPAALSTNSETQPPAHEASAARAEPSTPPQPSEDREDNEVILSTPEDFDWKAPQATRSRARRPKPADRPVPVTAHKSASASAELKVVVVPFGEVWVDDKYVGQSPISVSLPAGTHTVAIGEGRAREQRTVTLGPGEHEQVVFRPAQPEG